MKLRVILSGLMALLLLAGSFVPVVAPSGSTSAESGGVVRAEIFDIGNPIDVVDAFLDKALEFIEPLMTELQSLLTTLVTPLDTTRLKYEAMKKRLANWGPFGVVNHTSKVWTDYKRSPPDPNAGLIYRVPSRLPRGGGSGLWSGGTLCPPGAVCTSPTPLALYSPPAPFTSPTPTPTPGASPSPTPTPTPGQPLIIRCATSTDGGDLTEWTNQKNVMVASAGWVADGIPAYYAPENVHVYKFNSTVSGVYELYVDLIAHPIFGTYQIIDTSGTIAGSVVDGFKSDRQEYRANLYVHRVSLVVGQNAITMRKMSGSNLSITRLRFVPYVPPSSGAAPVAARSYTASPSASPSYAYTPSASMSSTVSSTNTTGSLGMDIMDFRDGTFLGTCRKAIRLVLAGLVWSACLFWIFRQLTIKQTV